MVVFYLDFSDWLGTDESSDFLAFGFVVLDHFFLFLFTCVFVDVKGFDYLKSVDLGFGFYFFVVVK